MAGTEDLERAVEMLFLAPPEDFTETRNALAKRLKAEGDAEGANRVGALRRPVRSAWAVNRLVHEDRASVEELLAAGERLRTAQRRAMSTKDAEGLREGSEERGRLVNLLTRKAALALGEEPPAVVIEEISATFEAASANAGAAREVLEGRLSKPLARPAGFGDVFGLKVVPGLGREKPPPPDDRAERALREREVRTAERQEQQARERAARLRAELATLKGRLAEREEQLRAVEAEGRAAANELKRLGRS